MTGPETQTLAKFVDFAKEAFQRLEGKVDKLDERVRSIETASAVAVGVAKHDEEQAEGRVISTGRWLAYLASVATIAGVIVGVILKFV